MLQSQRKWGAAIMLAACGVVPFVGGCGTASAPAGTASAPTGTASAPAAGGGGGGGDSPVVVRDGSNGRTVSVTVGEHLEVILASSYWTVQGSSQPQVLQQDGPTKLMPRPAGCAANIPGLGCVPVRTDFSALTPGTTVITASRTSCGEAMRCMPKQQHYTLTVVVRAKA
jgi:hypothetical protein